MYRWHMIGPMVRFKRGRPRAPRVPPQTLLKARELAARVLTAIEENPEQAAKDTHRIVKFIAENPAEARAELISALARGLKARL